MEPCKTRNNLLAIRATVQVASCVFFCGSHQYQLYYFFLSALSHVQFSPPRRECRAHRAEQPSATAPTGGATDLVLAGTPPSSPSPSPLRNNSECLRAEEVDRSAAEESAATAVRAARYTTPLFSQSGGEGGEIHCPSPPPKRRRGRRGSDGEIHSPPSPPPKRR